MMSITLYNKDLLDLALCGFVFGLGWFTAAWVVSLVTGAISSLFSKRQ